MNVPSAAAPSGPQSWVRGPTAERPAPTPTPTQAPAPAPTPVPDSPVRRRPAPSPASDLGWGAPQAARAQRRSRDDVGWVKAHGGAGTTSLAEALGGVDIGARWPQASRGEPRRVLLVGRTSAGGLRSVSQALSALREDPAAQGVDLLGVVLVADAPGRLPLSLLRRIRVIRSVAPVHRVPWIPGWRVGSRRTGVPKQLAALAELVGARPENAKGGKDRS